MRNTNDILVNGVKLSEIIKEHNDWLYNNGGKCANLSGADLSGADLSCADLSGADLRDANLRGVDLRDANLSDADLSDADLSDADLRDADLRCANLRGANISGANLSDVDLRGADLSDADYGSIQCPEEGSFIAFKKLRNNLICKLEIPSDALRSSATSRKCRASKAIVIAIYDKEKEVNEGISKHDNTFIYKVGETLEIKDFNTNRWNECASGIHFFITKQEAIDY